MAGEATLPQHSVRTCACINEKTVVVFEGLEPEAHLIGLAWPELRANMNPAECWRF